MRKILAFALLLSICAGILMSSGSAASADAPVKGTIEQTIKALGIIVGDENGNMNLGDNVTRAEFCKMMVSASVFKDSVGKASGVSVFKDVKYSHWAAGYIKTAVESGWFTGYSDGTFRPNNTIKLEEAASALIRLLGYTHDDLPGTYPTAQLNKFSALRLDKDMTKKMGQTLTRADCMQIFYNLMGAKTKSGAVYGQTLGYTLTAGEIDYSSLIRSEMEGPFIAGSGGSMASLPFSTANITVFRDGNTAQPSAIKEYDVYYYNANIRTIWAYSKKATGQYTEAYPSIAAPSSVTVAGVSYQIGTGDAAYMLSSLGEYKLGDTVTLLLGMDGEVVSVMPSTAASSIEYGMITACEKLTYTDSSGKVITENQTTIICSDGVMRKYLTGLRSYSIGVLVSVSHSDGVTSISELSRKSLSGKINAAGTMLGSLKLSSDVQILDTSSGGGYAVIYPSRIAGALLEEEDILFYTLDKEGNVDRLFLNDITGDIHSYGIVKRISTPSSGINLVSSYEYVINGVSGLIKLQGRALNIDEGPSIFISEKGSVEDIKNLKGLRLSSLDTLLAVSSYTSYPVSQNVQVYELKDDTYILSNINTISDTSKYILDGYLDTGFPAGNEIRIIIARAK